MHKEESKWSGGADGSDPQQCKYAWYYWTQHLKMGKMVSFRLWVVYIISKGGRVGKFQYIFQTKNLYLLAPEKNIKAKEIQ